MSMTVDTLELEEAQPQANTNAPSLIPRDMELIKHVKVELVVEIGTAELTVEQLFALKAGDVVKLAQQVNEPAALCVDGRRVAFGNLVAVEDNFGLHLTEIL